MLEYWGVRGQHSHSSGAWQTCAFPVFPALVASKQGRQDYHSCSHQCWSFPSQNNENIFWNFLSGSAHWLCFPFCPSSHAELVPFILTVQRDLSAILPMSHLSWRDICAESLLWIYVIYTTQHNSCTLCLFKGRKSCKMNHLYVLTCCFLFPNPKPQMQRVAETLQRKIAPFHCTQVASI